MSRLVLQVLWNVSFVAFVPTAISCVKLHVPEKEPICKAFLIFMLGGGVNVKDKFQSLFCTNVCLCVTRLRAMV